MKRKIEAKCEEWRGGNTMTANPILLQKKYVRVAGTTRLADEYMIKELLFEGSNRYYD